MVHSEESSISQQPNMTTRSSGKDELPGGGNIDKIRDIIFGNQMCDYEKRFE